MLERANSLGKDVVDSYFNRLDDGTPIKSAAMLLRDKEGDPIGMLCINIDLSIPLFDFAREIIPKGSGTPEQIIEHFPSNLNELLSGMLETIALNMNKHEASSPAKRKKVIIMELYKKGVFDIKGAIDVVANKIGSSRYTVYNHIRDAKMHNIKK